MRIKVNIKNLKYALIILIAGLIHLSPKVHAIPFSDHTFLIAEANKWNVKSRSFWQFVATNNNIGVEFNLSSFSSDSLVSESEFSLLLERLDQLNKNDESKIIPVFLSYEGSISRLDSIINNSQIASNIFYLPQGETWPSQEYLIQANRRIILFIREKNEDKSPVLHNIDNYIFHISANEIADKDLFLAPDKKVNQELFMIDNFDELRTASNIPFDRNLNTQYINYLLENWTKYGKRPNFIFTGTKYDDLILIVSQLNSFPWIKGTVKISGKTLDKVYWKNQDIFVTGGNFCFPYKGGEELMLSAYAPGYQMTPEQIIITSEMQISENYSILATPLEINNNLRAKFGFENIIKNDLDPTVSYNGENFSFTQDIDRGNVIKLPENASVNLGNPEKYGLRNNSFTVSCFVKFTEILEFGDNAILGNYEREYRRGLHLILRSGHPYFGLWANDYISEMKLAPYQWYHLVWRYIIETGEQAIFLNGKNIGSSSGHLPFSGTGDILLGSALSEGASLRGYVDDLYFWNRPLGNEEINRLALNEEVKLKAPDKKLHISNKLAIQIFFILVGITFVTLLLLYFRKRTKANKPSASVQLPSSKTANQIQLFSEFKVIDSNGENITKLFTPKVKELFLYVLIHTIRNEVGARISDINEHLWSGIEPKKIANNRAVTLNKLRKILKEINGIEIEIQNRYLVAQLDDSLFCDYIEAFKLCKIPGGMSKQQLETFFALVKKGRFLKGTTLDWMDEIKGFTGNQVLDNLINLASIYIKEKKIDHIDSIAKRILDYDDLNEEAIYLQIWVLQRTNNTHLAKFNFKSFCGKYQENMGESYPMNFDQFINYYSEKL